MAGRWGVLMALMVLGCGDSTPPASKPAPTRVAKKAKAKAKAEARGPSSKPASDAPVVPPPAADPPKVPSDAWIPEASRGWEKTDTVRHDLDGDGDLDVAHVLTGPSDDAMGPNRLVVVGMTGPDGIERVLASPCLALCTTCGGVWGDPYAGLSVVGERSLKIAHYGGSNWRWSQDYTLAWRDGAMRVVGFDQTSFHTSKPDSMTSSSINLLSGKLSVNEGPLKAHSLQAMPGDACSDIEGLATYEP